jgi:hypothetical protein
MAVTKYSPIHFHKEINMKPTNIKTTGLWAGIVLTFCSFGVYAAENHMEEALKHAQASAKATDGKSIAEHADTARKHAKASDEHLDAGISSLDQAIEHGKQDHTDMAKKAAEEAVTHLKAAQ